MTNLHWIKQQKPTDILDRRQFKILHIMKTHIKYCPIDNEGEVHVMRVYDFRKRFKQST